MLCPCFFGNSDGWYEIVVWGESAWRPRRIPSQTRSSDPLGCRPWHSHEAWLLGQQHWEPCCHLWNPTPRLSPLCGFTAAAGKSKPSYLCPCNVHYSLSGYSYPPGTSATREEIEAAMLYQEHICACLDKGPVVMLLRAQPHYFRPGRPADVTYTLMEYNIQEMVQLRLRTEDVKGLATVLLIMGTIVRRVTWGAW